MDCFDGVLLLLLFLAGLGVWIGHWRNRARHRQLESRVERLEAEAAAARWRAGAPKAELQERQTPDAAAQADRSRTPAPSEEGARPAAPPLPSKPPIASSPAPRAARDVEPRGKPLARPAVASSGAPADASPGALADAETVRPAARARPQPSLESLVGGRVLLISGVVVVLFGLGFFLKYAIDRAWLGPGGRILLGVLAGLGATFGGDRLRSGGRHAYGTALMGAGLGALYLSIYFATARYAFLGAPAGFALTALVTAVAAALALARNAPLLAYLGFLGGLLAPALLGTGQDALGPLTVWLLFVEAGVLAVVWMRPWQGLELMTLVASIGYFLAWTDRFLAPGRELAAFGALCALTGGILTLALLPPLARRRRVPTSSFLTLALASLALVLFGHELLFPERRELLALVVFALAAVELSAAVPVAPWAARHRDDCRVLAALGIAALATAFPILLEGRPLAPAWAAAGCAVVFVGVARRRAEFAVGGLIMICLAFVPLLSQPMHAAAFVPFLNAGFWVWAAPAAALVLAGHFLSWVKEWPPAVGAVAAGAGVWMLAPVLALEFYDHFVRSHPAGSYGAVELAWASSTAAVCVYAGAVAWFARTSTGIVRLLTPAGPLAFGVLLGTGVALFAHRHPFTPGLNAVFLACLTVIAALATASVAAGGKVRTLLLRGALAYGLYLITTELLLYGVHRELVDMTRQEARYGAQIAISVAWTLYAAGLLGLGFLRRAAELRWAGLTVFMLTLGKVFLFDMASLPAVYRIGSFLVLGVLSIAASFLYQRAQPGETPPPA